MRIKDEETLEEKRKEIIQDAITIINEEGVEQLSIRKIANKMKQTPGIIYHYFANKEEILTRIIEEGYNDILHSLQQRENNISIVQKRKKSLTSYMHCMLAKETLFILLMSSKNPLIQEKTYILNDEALQRQSLQMLTNAIQEGVYQGIFTCEEVGVCAQWIWCSTYGVITRLIQEQVTSEMKEKMIQQHVKAIVASLQRR